MRKLTVSGSYFDIGYQIGRFGKKQIRRALEFKDGQIKSVLQKRGELRDTKRLIRKNAPHLLQELRGIAIGAEVDFEKLLAKHCPEVVNAYGCTTVAIKNDECFFVAHNEDDDDWLGANSYALITYQPRGQTQYTAFVTWGDLPGSTFGWNEAGLFFAVDAMVQPRPARLPNLPRYFQNAILIEQTSLAAAIKFLRHTEAASSDHYLIADTKSKKAIGIEKLGGAVSLRRIDGSYVHTNHFIHPRFKSEYNGTENFGTSKQRFVIADKEFTKEDDIDTVVLTLRSLLKRPLHKNDATATWATAVCDLNTGLVSVVS